MTRIILLLCFFVIYDLSDLKAQVRTSIETSGIISSGDSTPFWLQANRHGVYSPEGSQFLTRFQFHGLQNESGVFNIRYGADLIARPGNHSTFSFNQGYVKIQAAGVELAAGRFHNTSPIHDEELGMGSLGISTNITPIPQVRLGLINWTPLPFTKEFVEIRGHISHGWLGSRRYTDNLLLHEKVGHIRLGGRLPFNLYAGLAHYAQWGGYSPDIGNIPARLKDFSSVFFALAGDEQTPGPDQAYILGNHLGAWDFGFFLDIGETNITVYRQLPLETKDNLKLKSLQDALNGISIQFPDHFPLPVNRFVYEFLYTKYQDGPRRDNVGGNPDRDLYRGNENYYNHEVYKSGWVYNYRTIGNPLFTLSGQNPGIMNNRIVAHHLGFMSDFDQIRFSFKATYSRNYGKYCDNRIPDLGDQELFGIRCENLEGTAGRARVDMIGGHAINQWSFLSGIQIPLNMIEGRNISLQIEMAYDNGALAGDNFGGLVGLRWAP